MRCASCIFKAVIARGKIHYRRIPRSACITIFRIFVFSHCSVPTSFSHLLHTSLDCPRKNISLFYLFVRIIRTKERLINILLEKNINTFFTRVNCAKKMYFAWLMLNTNLVQNLQLRFSLSSWIF